LVILNKKRCSRCKLIKSLRDFAKNKSNKDGLSCYCKSCRNSYARNYRKGSIEAIKEIEWKYKNKPEAKAKRRKLQNKIRQENPEKYRLKSHSQNLKRIGSNLEYYNKLFQEQEGKCFLCNKHQTQFKKALGHDHNHKTGQLRKLLCDGCNLLVGLVENKKEIVIKIFDYLDFVDG